MATRVLEDAAQCVLFMEGPRAALVPCWFDGANLWLADRFGELHVSTGDEVQAWIPPAGERDPGVVAHGVVRRFGKDDPKGLLLHAPVLLGVMTAMELAVPPSLPDLGRAVRRSPVRVSVRRLVASQQPAPRAGMGPALPPVVPAEVRREVGTPPVVTAAVQSSAGLVVIPTTWDGRMTVAGFETQPEGARANVVALGKGLLSGVALSGRIATGGRLEPQEASWWSGNRSGSGTAAGPSFRLPD